MLLLSVFMYLQPDFRDSLTDASVIAQNENSPDQWGCFYAEYYQAATGASCRISRRNNGIKINITTPTPAAPQPSALNTSL